jgi:peptidoglycan L-alanyl-D-glutamate endopeptidase CwlK
MGGVNMKLVNIAHRALEISPIDFGIGRDGGLRTAEHQTRLWNAGASSKNGTTYFSKHQYGAALDPAPWEKGPSNKPVSYAIVAAAFLVAAGEMGIKLWWGGLWPNYIDMPHLQLDPSEYEIPEEYRSLRHE